MPYPFISGDESLLRSKSFVNIVRQKDFIFTRIIIGFRSMHTEVDLIDALKRAELALDKLGTDET